MMIMIIIIIIIIIIIMTAITTKFYTFRPILISWDLIYLFY